MIGSYTSIGYRPAQDGQPMVPGGDLYPTLIRKNPIKPIKIFLQDGSARSRQRARQLVPREPADARGARVREHAPPTRQKTAGPRYEVRHEWGDGAHSDAHGGALLPDILRWIWSDGGR